MGGLAGKPPAHTRPAWPTWSSENVVPHRGVEKMTQRPFNIGHHGPLASLSPSWRLVITVQQNYEQKTKQQCRTLVRWSRECRKQERQGHERATSAQFSGREKE